MTLAGHPSRQTDPHKGLQNARKMREHMAAHAAARASLPFYTNSINTPREETSLRGAALITLARRPRQLRISIGDDEN